VGLSEKKGGAGEEERGGGKEEVGKGRGGRRNIKRCTVFDGAKQALCNLRNKFPPKM
jgi:hypothetical protein